METVLQSRLPFDPPWAAPGGFRLPGTRPLPPGDWILVDDAHAGQMALRDRLIATRREEVHALPEAARPAARELLAEVLAALPRDRGYRPGEGEVTRPDGVAVPIDPEAPLLTLGRLVQQDFCLLERPAGAAEHLLSAAILCFPASWTLAEKLGRPLGRIHAPVPAYDAGLATRVQRLFDGIRPGAPLWRANALLYSDPALFQPRPEHAPRVETPATAAWLRSERQAFHRLPRTGAVVFSIHSVVMRLADLPEGMRTALLAHRGGAAAAGG